ncbi:protein-L-isoaspartate(D-aspartate) O-methyltransferase [Kitasatospora sp. MAP5-34]|uniref:protein-L-isoaspartate(D-aspartate) O-methyltransferase n=1 Tax=Kitasatospora sp. MAP5-34 TaxID=3035102 RepID=UPI002474F3D7|nr:protein-L-isoaspartate(D-aspartate) O-methyltransferase [Kitasatospora sp. MAP5-34]MDH6579522.1 protein-L-isoaspartate O-methyltransferase [Kitasatospora sp. MAP5-34]
MSTTVSPTELRRSLADRLRARGAITSAHWYDAFATVPREPFVPSFKIRTKDGVMALAEGDPDWLPTVYSDDSLLIKFSADDVATSSSTMPTLMALMLEALDVRDGDRVREIATGTAYNAALLCHRVGSANVVTVEVDAALSRAAERRLAALGHTPLVIAGDGRAALPGVPRCHRLIATCAFESIPAAWLRETEPGGVIVCPMGGGIVRLVVEADGTAEGRFLPDSAFFMVARDASYAPSNVMPPAPDSYLSSSTGVSPEALREDGLHFLLSLVLPGVFQRFEHAPDGSVRACEFWDGAGSWARVEGGTARQAGPRRLWDIVEEAYVIYQESGQPRRERYGLSVTPDSQLLWLDTPGSRSWRLA